MTIQDAGRHGLSADDARTLANTVLGMSQADNARVSIQSGRRGFFRSADNRITTAGASTDVSVSIMSGFGKRVASVTTNRLDTASLEDAVRRSEGLARLAPEDPEYLHELPQQEYVDVAGYYPSTGALSPDPLAEATAHAIAQADEAGFVASGYLDVRAGANAVATSAGLFAHHAETGVASTLTVRTRDGSSSGWAGDEAADWGEIETERIARDAVQKCREWQQTQALDPGLYDVVLEPTATGMLMLRMLGAFNARPADEGRSYFSSPAGGSRIGDKLFDSRVTLVSDPATPNAEVEPYTDEGLPRARTVWVQNGVLQNLSYSRFWADRQNHEPQPGPANLIVSGGKATVDDMIRATRRGVLITRFWYIRGLNPRTLSYTGLTRDGTFLIENGRVSRPVNNFRFNQSLVDLLSNVELLGRPTRVAAGENSSVGTPMIVPAMKVRSFNLASVSDAI